jgi:hypothetical protein
MPRHSNPDYEGNPVQRILETPDRQEVKEAVIVVVSWFGGDKSRKLGKKRDAIGGAKLLRSTRSKSCYDGNTNFAKQ